MCKSDKTRTIFFKFDFIFYWFLLMESHFLDEAQKRPNQPNCQKVLEICIKRTHHIFELFDATVIFDYFSCFLLSFLIKFFSKWLNSFLNDDFFC